MVTRLEESFLEISKEKFLQEFNGSTVLITGATGLIGSMIIKALLYYNKLFDGDIRVIGIARNKEKVKRIYEDMLMQGTLKIYYADLTKDSVEIIEKIDYIIHTASVTTSKSFVTYPVETINTIYQGTKNILELALTKKCKGIVYLSSMEVYGLTNPDLEKVNEKDLGYIDILSARSSYSEGKRIAECLCSAYANEYEMPVKIARLAQTFGAGVLPEDNRVYAQFARSVIAEENIVLHTEGKSSGNYCEITDAIRAILFLLRNGENGQAYNVCNEANTMTIAEMAQMVAEEFGKGKSRVVYECSGNVYGYAPDVKMVLSSQKLRELGWMPKYSLKDMYEKMIETM